MSASSAQTVYDFLSPTSPEPLQSADAIIGFGHFDPRIARYCGELWATGLAPRVIFTGGIGAGSADLSVPEAQAFADILQTCHPQFPSENLLLETTSTNTGENIELTLQLAEARGWSLARVILVATPFRQLRVAQTWRHHLPDSTAQNAPPPSSLDEDIALFATKDEDFIAQLPGEIDRLQNYPNKGWIAPVEFPREIIAAAQKL